MTLKRERTGVSFDPAKLERYRAVASARFAGNLSALITEALDSYVDGAVVLPTSSDNCMVELAKEIAPFIAPDIAKLVAGQDQKKILASILISYAGGDYSDPNSMQLSPEFKAALKREGFAK